MFKKLSKIKKFLGVGTGGGGGGPFVPLVTTGDGDKFASDSGDYRSAPQRGTTEMRAQAGTSGPPSDGRVRWNNASQTLATELFVSETNDASQDLENYLSGIELGDGIYLQNSSDAGNYQVWGVNSITDSGSYKTISVTLLDSAGGDFSTGLFGQRLLYTIQKGAATLNQIQENQNSVDSQTVVVATPEPDDYFAFYDHSDASVKLSDLRTIVGASRVDAYVAGTGEDIDTTTVFQPLEIFTDAFYSSSAAIIKSPDDTGFTVLAPLRYKATASGWMRTNASDDFEFQIFAGGVAVGVPIQVSGDGNSKAIDFTVIAFTGLLSTNDKIEVRVKDNGDDINDIAMTFDIEFAGVD